MLTEAPFAVRSLRWLGLRGIQDDGKHTPAERELVEPRKLAARAFSLMVYDNPGDSINIASGAIKPRNSVGKLAGEDYYVTQEVIKVETPRGYSINYTGFYLIKASIPGEEQRLVFRIGEEKMFDGDGEECGPDQVAQANMVLTSLENQIGVNRNLNPRFYNIPE